MEVVKTRSWTKWGGGKLMAVKEHLQEWTCQACGQPQAEDCPAWLFPLGENNYIRICSECRSKVVHLHIESFHVLKEEVTPPGHWVDNIGKE